LDIADASRQGAVKESKALCTGNRQHHASGTGAPGLTFKEGLRHERKMPERWYELLRERMQIEQLRMGIANTATLLKTTDCKTF
jgi:hypothetical protein